MRLSPLGERPTDAALARDVELGGELADIVQNEKASRRQCTVPEVELRERRLIFVGAVDDNQLRIAAEIIPGCQRGLRIERIPLGDFHKTLQAASRYPTPGHFATRRVQIQAEKAMPGVHPTQHPSQEKSRVSGFAPTPAVAEPV